MNRPFRRRSRGRSFGEGMLGGLVGGVIGGAIANAADDDKPTTKAPSTPELETILKRVTQVPVGGTVYLKVEEFRVLQDKNLINYKETVPYCMERVIEV